MFRWTEIKFLRLSACILMILALGWLTVSLPVVAKAKKLYSIAKSQTADDSNPLTNTTEEKTPPSFNEEYLHHEEALLPSSILCFTEHPRHSCPDLPHYHSELITPPPEA